MMWTARSTTSARRREYTGIALEYGTVPVLETLQALRGDHWLHVHPRGAAGTGGRGSSSRCRMPSTRTPTSGKARCSGKAREALFQAADGLAS